jgi:hypothetical protein
VEKFNRPQKGARVAKIEVLDELDLRGSFLRLVRFFAANLLSLAFLSAVANPSRKAP